MWTCYFMIRSSIPFLKSTNSNKFLLCARAKPLFSRNGSSTRKGKANVQPTTAQGRRLKRGAQY